MPFVFADLLGVQRDGVLRHICGRGVRVFWLWVRATDQSLREMIPRRWLRAIRLGFRGSSVVHCAQPRRDGATLSSRFYAEELFSHHRVVAELDQYERQQRGCGGGSPVVAILQPGYEAGAFTLVERRQLPRPGRPPTRVGHRLQSRG